MSSAVPERTDAPEAPEAGRASGGVEVVSFEAGFEEELTQDLGDLGPAPVMGRDGGERSDRGGPRRPGTAYPALRSRR